MDPPQSPRRSSSPAYLPLFRVRQLDNGDSTRAAALADDTSGVVSIRRKSYDGLLARNPDAALTYVDDEDGEPVTVGTSFELAQRLDEPVEPAIQQWNKPSAPRATHGIHSFDVSDTLSVRSAWTPYLTPPFTLSVPDDSATSISVPPHIGSLTPAGHQQARDAASVLSLAQKRPFPLHLEDRRNQSPHAARWAAYGSLPAAFGPSSDSTQRDARPAPLASADTEAHVDRQAQAAKRAKLEAVQAARRQEILEGGERLSGVISQGRIPATTAAQTTDTAAQTQPNYESSHTQTNAAPAPEPQPNYESSHTQTHQLPTPNDFLGASIRGLMDGLGLPGTRPSPDGTFDMKELASTFQKEFTDFVKDRARQSVLSYTADWGSDRAEASASAPTTHEQQDASTQSAPETRSPREFSPKPASRKNFTVEKLIARRYISYHAPRGPRITQYLVRWVGHGPEEDVWYDVESLVDCASLVDEYEARHPEYAHGPGAAPYGSDVDLLQLHARAADRMITYQPRLGRRQDTTQRPTYPMPGTSKQAEDASREHARAEKAAQRSGDTRADKAAQRPKPIWAEPSSKSSQRELRHRRSWHPSSRRKEPESSAFEFSPMDVMKRFPPVTFLDDPMRPTVAHGEFSTPRREVGYGLDSDADYDSSTALHDSLRHPETTGHHVDASLYAPPSPLLTTSSPAKGVPSADAPPMNELRRAQSLNVVRDRSESSRSFNKHAELHMQAQRDAEEGRQVQGRHMRHAAEPPRRANTTATGRAESTTADRGVGRSRAGWQREADTRRNNVSHCTRRLAEMGFAYGEASIVAETVSGDLETALDILNEDGRAHDEVERRKRKKQVTWEPRAETIPGAFTW